MDKNILLRLGIDIVIAICVIYGWWFIALPLGIFSLFKFPYYIELIIAGFAYDSLFGMNLSGSEGTGFIFSYLGTIGSILISIFAGLFKTLAR